MQDEVVTVAERAAPDAVGKTSDLARPRLTPAVLLRYLLHGSILAVFFFIPWWLRPDWTWLPTSPAPYFLGFLVAIPTLLAIVAWVLLGAPGLRAALQDSRMLWITPLAMLTGWACLSTLWAIQQDVAVAWALQFAVVALFALVCACAGPSARTVVVALAVGLLFQGLVVSIQFQTQNPIGLSDLGEFSIRPGRKGLSVVQAGNLELMRPYGLTAHPNMIGGYLAAGLLGLTGWFAVRKGLARRWKVLVFVLMAVGLWALCVTFSRSAWGGLVIGLGLILILWARAGLLRPFWRRWLAGALVALLVIGLFVSLYSNFIMARVDTGDQSAPTEKLSVATRRLFIGYALEIIYEHPLNGVGVGDFAYAALEILKKSPYAGWLLAENVHNLPLLVASELGLIGLTLWLAALLGWFIVVWRKVRDPFAIGLAAASLALLAVGMLDHYPWSIFHYALLLWAPMGLSLAASAGPGKP